MKDISTVEVDELFYIFEDALRDCDYVDVDAYRYSMDVVKEAIKIFKILDIENVSQTKYRKYLYDTKIYGTEKEATVLDQIKALYRAAHHLRVDYLRGEADSFKHALDETRLSYTQEFNISVSDLSFEDRKLIIETTLERLKEK